MKKILSILLLCFCFSTNAQDPATAPNFVVTDILGETHELYEYLGQGKYVVVNFTGTWSGPDQNIAEHFGQGFIDFGCNYNDVVFISIDTGSDTQACIDFELEFMPGVHGLPMVSGMDGGGDAAHNAYGINAVPTIITISPLDTTYTDTYLGFYAVLPAGGSGGCQNIVYGCNEDWADNYNPNATENDGSCYKVGCTSDWADNYDELATLSSTSGFLAQTSPHSVTVGSGMTYSPNQLTIVSGDNVTFTSEGGSHDVNFSTNSITGMPFDNPADIEYLPIQGAGLMGTITFNVPGTYNYDCSVYGHASMGMVGEVVVTALVSDTVDCIRLGCTSYWADNYDELATDDNGSCELTACPYPYYLEYDSNYTVADISMCITYIIEGCTNSLAENYNPDATLEDGTCVIFGCMSEDADNYNPEATLQDDSCILYGCTNETAENYNNQATDDAGSCIIYGCTISIFPNYNPEATVDDLSCNPVGIEVYGCTDDNALNYISQANTDNGSCLYQEDDCSISIQEEDIPLYLPEGWVLFGYTCLEPLDLTLGFESIIDRVIIVKDSDGNAYLPEWNFNGIGNLIYSRGYQIKTTEEITDFSFCPTLISAEEVSSPQYQLGDLAEGGIVFYVDSTGQHGLVAAMQDLTEGATDFGDYGYNGYSWGCMETYIGADLTSIGTGLQNTLDIVENCSETPIAASEALAYETEGYSDWFLPSQSELLEMYNTIGQGSDDNFIGSFDNARYWSSSENNESGSWFVYFFNGGSIPSSKLSTNKVRPIRSF